VPHLVKGICIARDLLERSGSYIVHVLVEQNLGAAPGVRPGSRQGAHPGCLGQRPHAGTTHGPGRSHRRGSQ
jgi:hypothetical protein